MFFSPDNGPAGVSKGGAKIVDGEIPGITVLGYGEPSAMVDVTGTEGFFPNGYTKI